MPVRVEVALRPAVTDTQGNKTAHKIRHELGLAVDRVRIIRVYFAIAAVFKLRVNEVFNPNGGAPGD